MNQNEAVFEAHPITTERAGLSRFRIFCGCGWDVGTVPTNAPGVYVLRHWADQGYRDDSLPFEVLLCPSCGQKRPAVDFVPCPDPQHVGKFAHDVCMVCHEEITEDLTEK